MTHTKVIERECSRKNFDSLLWATLTVFQVMTSHSSVFVVVLSFVSSRLLLSIFSLICSPHCSILGMHLFGGEFCTIQAFNLTTQEDFSKKCRCCTCVENEFLKNATDLKDLKCHEERKNFDSLTYAVLTVFQVEQSCEPMRIEWIFSSCMLNSVL